jgi:hypothetical protein
MEDLSRFISEDSDIIERLNKETPIQTASFDDFLKLPVNEEYKRNQERNKIGVEESKEEK